MKHTAYVITKPAEEGACKWCDKVLDAIDQAIGAGIIHLVDHAPLPLPARQAYYAGSGTKTIPQVYMVDEDGFSVHVGGYEETLVWIEDNGK